MDVDNGEKCSQLVRLKVDSEKNNLKAAYEHTFH